MQSKCSFAICFHWNISSCPAGRSRWCDESLICMCDRVGQWFAYVWVCIESSAVYVDCIVCMFKPLPSAQLKSDLVKEVAYTRRKQHQASLQYYCALNALQYRKRVAMLEPMLGYTQAQVLGSLVRTPLPFQYTYSVFKNKGTGLVFKCYLFACKMSKHPKLLRTKRL